MTDTLEQIYSEIPRLNCKQKCQESCGPIMLSNLELERMAERAPHLHVPALDTGMGSMLLDYLDCPFLAATGACGVYSARPLVCRLFGVVEKMRCPFGCEPERWLSDEEGYALLDRVIALSVPSAETR